MMSGINDYIASEVKSNDVVLFMKGTPGFPQCGFSGQVVQILDYVGVDYKGVNVTSVASCARASRTIPTGRPFPSFM
jgi:monothiol glutaredoxin